jgi:hypothetical protein
MSRGFGRWERRILAVLEADQDTTVCVRLETLVFAVTGCLARLDESYDHWALIYRRPVCDCKPSYLPGFGRHPFYDHTEACYPSPEPPTRAQVSAIHRAVRSLERKGRLRSARIGEWLSSSWGSTYPGRVTVV